jgi:DNA-binding transcriptional LysR family regulator
MNVSRVVRESLSWNNNVPMVEQSHEESLEGWGVFVRVVDLRSFSAAARSLHMAKASVSRSMARLEERLGVPLLQRTTRSLALTEAGEVLYARARDILEEVREAEEEARELGGSVRGTLRVAAPVSFAAANMAPYVPAFLAAHPKLRIELEVEDRFTDLVAGRFDVALRLANLPDSSLRARRLAPSRRLLAASPAYLSRAGVPKKPADLVQHACITYAHQLAAPMDQWLFRKRGSETFAMRVSGPLTVNNGEVLRGLLLADAGIGLAPLGLIADDLRSGRLVPLLVGQVAMDASVYAVMPQKRSPPAKVRAFVDFLAQAYKPPPWEAGLEHLFSAP